MHRTNTSFVPEAYTEIKEICKTLPSGFWDMFFMHPAHFHSWLNEEVSFLSLPGQVKNVEQLYLWIAHDDRDILDPYLYIDHPSEEEYVEVKSRLTITLDRLRDYLGSDAHKEAVNKARGSDKDTQNNYDLLLKRTAPDYSRPEKLLGYGSAEAAYSVSSGSVSPSHPPFEELGGEENCGFESASKDAEKDVVAFACARERSPLMILSTPQKAAVAESEAPGAPMKRAQKRARSWV